MKKSKYKTKSKSKIKPKLPDTRMFLEPDENIFTTNEFVLVQHYDV